MIPSGCNKYLIGQQLVTLAAEPASMHLHSDVGSLFTDKMYICLCYCREAHNIKLI